MAPQNHNELNSIILLSLYHCPSINSALNLVKSTSHRTKPVIQLPCDISGPQEWPLSTYPDWTGMLGGTEVLVSGPCFPPGSGILCKFDDVIVDGFMVKYLDLKQNQN